MDPWLQQVEATEGWLSLDEARLLHRYAGEALSGCIVEVGSYRGRSTIALASGAPEGVPVYAVDPHEEFTGPRGGSFGPEDRRAFFENMVSTGAWARVRLVNLSSEVVTPGWVRPVAVLWIDGDHRYKAVRRDVDAWVPHLTADAKVLLDDSTKPKSGPGRVLVELLESGSYEIEQQVGKVTALRRTPS